MGGTNLKVMEWIGRGGRSENTTSGEWIVRRPKKQTGELKWNKKYRHPRGWCDRATVTKRVEEEYEDDRSVLPEGPLTRRRPTKRRGSEMIGEKKKKESTHTRANNNVRMGTTLGIQR
jgi:hypothetical protein